MYTYRKHKHSRNWAVYDPNNQLVTVLVYKKGAIYLANLLNQQNTTPALSQTGEPHEI